MSNPIYNPPKEWTGMVPMDNHLKVLAEFNKPLREKVEKAIRETLVIENKQSISIAITKIVDILKDSR